jgi:predicted enzyme related to lactoylglutathione lyase
MNNRVKRRRCRASQLLVGLLLGSALAAPGIAESLDLPALNEPASGEHHAGKVIWAELVTPDLAGAEQFYSGLFGWTFRDVSNDGTSTDSNFVVALLNGRPVAGLLHRSMPADGHAQPAWLTFLAVGNADDAGRIALLQGARILAGPKTYGHRGRQEILADPEGAVFAVLASASGDTPDVLAAPGEWIWSSLLARDADKEAAFYQRLLGYQVFELPSDDGKEHVILATDNYARASVNTLPGDSARRHPHWLNFVRVSSAVDSAAMARSLGGRVLVEPHPDRQGGQVAVIADPQGAPLGLMEWADAADQGNTK